MGGLGPCCSIHMQYFEPTFCKNQTHKIHFLFQNLIFTQILPCFSLQQISKERKVNCWFYLSVWNQIFWPVAGKRWCNQMKFHWQFVQKWHKSYPNFWQETLYLTRPSVTSFQWQIAAQKSMECGLTHLKVYCDVCQYKWLDMLQEKLNDLWTLPKDLMGNGDPYTAIPLCLKALLFVYVSCKLGCV